MTESAANSPVRTFLDGFLSLLRNNGFDAGVNRRLRAEQLLAGAAGEYGPDRLRSLLCPIFATTPDQQGRFLELFDLYFDRWKGGEVSAPPVVRVEPIPIGLQKSAPRPRRRVALHRYFWSSLAIGVTGGAILLGVAIYYTRNSEDSPYTAIGHVPAEKASTPAATLVPAALNVQLPPLPAPPALPDNWFWEDIAAILTVIMLPAATIFWARRNRGAPGLTFSSANHSPRSKWLKISAPPPAELFDMENLRMAAAFLGRREQAGRQFLDIGRSVSGLVSRNALPRLVFREVSRQPRYVVLIDRASFRDHLSALNEMLVRALEQEGVVLQVFTFESDPRLCWAHGNPLPLSLDHLAISFADASLMFFSDGHSLLDPWTGLPGDWTAVFRVWQRRALFAPIEAAGMRLPDELFQVQPATLIAIVHWASETAEMSRIAEMPPPAFPAAAGAPDRVVEYLQRAMQPDVFIWLSACAVYPELDWKLTLYLAGLPGMPAGLLQEERIRELAQLSWFSLGRIPDDVRLELLKRIPPEIEREVRRALVHLLEKAVPASSRQSPEFQLLFATQQYLAKPRNWLTFWSLFRRFWRTPRSEMTTIAAAEVVSQEKNAWLAAAQRKLLDSATIADSSFRQNLRLMVASAVTTLVILTFLSLSYQLRYLEWSKLVTAEAAKVENFELGRLAVLEAARQQGESGIPASNSPILCVLAFLFSEVPAWDDETGRILEELDSHREHVLRGTKLALESQALVFRYLLVQSAFPEDTRRNASASALTALWYQFHGAEMEGESAILFGSLRRALQIRLRARGISGLNPFSKRNPAISPVVLAARNEILELPPQRIAALRGLVQILAVARGFAPEAGPDIVLSPAEVDAFFRSSRELKNELLLGKHDLWLEENGRGIIPKSALRPYLAEFLSQVRDGKHILYAPKTLDMRVTVTDGSASEGSAVIQTTPPGAAIRVNREIRCTSNCTLTLDPGTYTITAALLGYKARSERLDLTAAATARPSPDAARLAPELAAGGATRSGPSSRPEQGAILRIREAIPGTEVFVDGVLAGTVGASKTIELTELKPGERAIEQRLAGRPPIRTTRQLRAGQREDVEGNGSPGPEEMVTLEVSGPPQSEVSLDGVTIGTIPATGTLRWRAGGASVPEAAEINPADFLGYAGPPRGHILFVRSNGAVVFRTVVQLSAGRSTSVSIAQTGSRTQSTSVFGTIRLLTSKAGSEILIDGLPVGTTDGSGVFNYDKVVPGIRAIEIRHRGLPAARTNQTIRANETVEISRATVLVRATASGKTYVTHGARTSEIPASASLSLAEGEYVFEARWPDGRTSRRSLTVVLGQTYSIYLSPETP